MVFDNIHQNGKMIYTSGKQFRASLRRPEPKLRVVPAFTIASQQRNTVVMPPPSCGVYKPRPKKETNFRKYYERGDFPMSIENEKIHWKEDLSKIDYHHYLPMFFEGLSEREYPYDSLVRMCIHEMLKAGGPRILPVIPQLIIPIKTALNTKVNKVVCNTLRILKELVMSADMVGEALVPYYRQILPPLNLLIKKNVNLGDGIDYTSMNGENVGDLIQETLEVLERYGGEDAFINIKYMIPTYESCVLN